MTDSGGIGNGKLAEALGRIGFKMQLLHCLDDDTYTAFKFFLANQLSDVSPNAPPPASLISWA